MVKYFPQYIMHKAYGITISQAVVTFEKHDDYISKKDELEYKLIKARNKSTIPLDSRFSYMKHTPRTGKPAYEKKKHNDKEEYFDKGNWQKNINADEAREDMLLEKLKLTDIYKKFPLDMEKISNKNNKVAVIHADGNKMGLMLQNIDKDLKNKSSKEIQELYKILSEQITKSTNDAVKTAFEKSFDQSDEKIPFRPVVIGGDDVTVICSADNALEFTKHYLEAFESNTEENFKKHKLSKYATKLTACAGVSFCNHKFPFHYAVDLSESLCSYAKEVSKREESCLAFHNIESSFFTDYKEYVKNELETPTGISLQYAPYYINKQPTISNLQSLYVLFDDDDIPSGKFREWLSELHKNEEYSQLYLERINAVLKKKISHDKFSEISKSLKELHDSLTLKNLIDSNNKTPLYDILQLRAVLKGDK